MAAAQDPTKPDIPPPDIENPESIPPVITPTDDPPPDLHDDPPPETSNLSQDEDEGEQAQTLADEQYRSGNDTGLSDTEKVGSGDEEDDVQDLVDHMNDMVASGRIDMDAFRGERNDDDEEGSLGPGAAQE